MKGKKATKRALLSSALSLVLCFSMLLGTTFAWFTDEAKTGVNTIQSGTLDIQLLDAEGKNSIEGVPLEFVKADTLSDDEKVLWEPGATYHTQGFQIKNAGNLWLKFEIVINGVSDGNAKLLEAIDFVISTDKEGKNGISLDNGGEMHELAPNSVFNDATYYLVGHMDEDAGNEYQDLKIEGVGITVFATQKDAEYDSFDNQYDADAAYGTLVTTNEELLAAIQDPNVLAIRVDGDLTYDWGSESYENSKALLMSGKTFFGADADASITFAGYGSANPITNVTLKNITVKDVTVGDDENAWEHGYLEFVSLIAENVVFADSIMLSGNSVLTNCSMNNTTPSWYGVWVNSGNATITGSTFTGTRAIKIHEYYGSEVASVAIDDCVFGLSEKPGVAIGTVNTDTSVSITNSVFDCEAGDQGKYIYESDTDVATFDFTEKNNKIEGFAVVSDNAGLTAAVNSGNSTIILTSGSYTLPSLSAKEGLTIEGAADGSTVVGGESATTGFGSNFGKNTTIKNVTFSGATNGVRYSYANGGTTTFDSCTFAGDSTYGFHIDQSNSATFIFNDCTFVGFNAFASDLEKVEFNNCTFLSNGNYGHTNIWSKGYFNNCTWGDQTSVGTRGNNAHLYFNNVEESYHHEYIGSAESLFAFAKTVNEDNDSWSGQKVILVDDIDLNNEAWTPIGQTGATQFKGIFDGQNYTIKNLNIDSSAQTDGHYSSGLFGWAEAGVTIKNVKIDGATVTGNHNVAALVGYTYSAVISNCHVSNATIVCNHKNDDACGDKCGLIVGYAGDESRITDCSGSNSTVTAGRDAGQLIGCGYNVSVSDCSVDNVTVSAGGDCTGANINNAIIGRVMG